MTETAQQSVTFVDDVSGEDSSDSRSLSLDSDYIENVYGESKTSFSGNEAAYLKFISTSDSSYTIDSSMGTMSVVGTDIPYEITDTIQFANSRTGTLSYVPVSRTITYDWLGRDGGVPVFNGTTVTIPEAKVAVLSITYKVYGDRLRLVVSDSEILHEVEEGEDVSVLAVVTQDSTNTSASVTFSTGEAETGELVPYNIQVMDLCTENPVNGATVMLDGENKGQTNEQGVLYLGYLTVGQAYTLEITKDGYTDSSSDYLANDEFTVPS